VLCALAWFIRRRHRSRVQTKVAEHRQASSLDVKFSKTTPFADSPSEAALQMRQAEASANYLV
jgi:hypothetical protein